MSQVTIDIADVSVVHEGLMMLRPTTFRVEGGDCLAVTGPNGSGKTTLLKILAGRLAPTTGTALINGAVIDESSSDFRKTVSALIGVPAYYDELTVADHLALLGRLWAESAAADVLDELGIEPLSDRFPRELSSGQQQLFQLALAFARPAAVLVLDEPEQRLDGERRNVLASMIRRRREAGAAVVLATHDGGLSDDVRTGALHLNEPRKCLPQ